MSHPKTVWKFIPWSKAMVAGATVGTPEYKGSRSTGYKASKTTPKRRKRRRKRKRNAKKE